MRKNILILLFTLLSISAYANGVIKGKIISENTELEFVSVGLSGTSFGGVSDQNGNFELTNVPYGKYKLVVSMLGYISQAQSITLNANNNSIQLNFDLKESATNLDEMVISGTMKPVSKLESSVPVEVYSTEFFIANPTPSIFESMQNVNGVRPQLNCSVCNTGDIHINGLEGAYTMVLLDGMPIVSGLSTVYGLMGIPQALIERVEIVKGPASTLYGSEAVGGLVNIITKKASNAPVFSADIFGTSWGEVSTDLGAKFGIGKKAQSLMGISYFNYQNPIDNNGDGFTDVTLQNRISIFNKLSFERKSKKTFTLAGRYIYEDRWGGEMNWSHKYRGGSEIYGESIYTKRWEAFGVYQLPTTEIINFQFSVNGHKQNSVYGNTPYIADQYVAFGQLTWNKQIGNKHDLMLGTAMRYIYYDDNTFATLETDGVTNQVAHTYLPGIFLQDEIQVGVQNKVLLGVRYDHNNTHGSIFSPRVNYKWSSLNKENIFRVSLGNGYRVANVFTEDHAALTGAREVVFEENLAPETSWNMNLNFVKKIYTSSNTYIGLDASAFYTHFENKIFADYETDPSKIIYANLNGKAISKGVSLNLDIALENGLTILAGATLMDVYSVEEGIRERQILTERVSGVWNIGYTFERINLKVDYTGNLYGPMRLPLLNEEGKEQVDFRDAESPFWSLQNIQLTKTLKNGLQIYGGVKNLLNYTPPVNSIARASDPFENDESLKIPFDPSYVFAPNQGIRAFLGVRYALK
ncbi:MAG: outer membrane receptor for ferrienterochelin and colicins [Arenicella sp.]|jgi:outer membrane receptor for ferrienterochelin and colicins